jgi:putative methionine-R-sulfoxide reductase with GAF domain
MSTEEQTKPVLDQQTFEKLLEAAYVLQEHNARMRHREKSLELQSEQLRQQEMLQQSLLQTLKPEPEASARPNIDYTLTLAEIVEAQHQIQTRHLGLDEAMEVVAERIMRIARANGAGIGIIQGATVGYRAAAGTSALPVGTEVPMKTAVCQANIRTGQVIRTKDVDTEFLFDPEPVRQRGIRSLVAVPIHYDGNIVGALELYFDRVEGYAEQDIHTCQLMAGLVTEAMGRETGATLKKSMDEERSTMLAAIEKLQPNLAALANEPEVISREIASHEVTSEERTWPGKLVAGSSCWKCGSHLLAGDQYCGKCGAAQAGDFGIEESDSNRPQVTPASSLFTQSEADALANSLALLPADDTRMPALPAKPAAAARQDVIWSSAAKAKDFLESLAVGRDPNAWVRFWRSRRGDFYLVISVILVLFVIGWGVWSSHSGSASSGAAISRSANKTRPDSDLSAFDKFLIAVGLAEAPETAPEYKGNPDIQVWIDLNTAQYYCPGSDLYEKTSKGKLSSQREAQLDQFEPAYRKACD